MVTWSIKLRVHTLNHKQEANQVNLSLCESLNLQNLEEETEAEAIEEGFFLVYTSSIPNCVLAPRTQSQEVTLPAVSLAFHPQSSNKSM